MPAEMITRFARTMTEAVTRSVSGPSTPPFLFRDVHLPLTPTAVFLAPTVSNRTFSTLNPSANLAPARCASGSQETTGPCFSAAPHPSVQWPQKCSLPPVFCGTALYVIPRRRAPSINTSLPWLWRMCLSLTPIRSQTRSNDSWNSVEVKRGRPRSLDHSFRTND